MWRPRFWQQSTSASAAVRCDRTKQQGGQGWFSSPVVVPSGGCGTLAQSYPVLYCTTYASFASTASLPASRPTGPREVVRPFHLPSL